MATSIGRQTRQGTQGTNIWWAAGTTLGEIPTSGWSFIPEITDWPRFGGTADSFEDTSIDVTDMKTYSMGLIDPGGSQDVTYNANAATVDEVDAMYAAQVDGKEVWIKQVVPLPMGMEYYYTVQVSPPIGSPAIAPNGMLQDTFSLVYTGNFSKAPITP